MSWGLALLADRALAGHVAVAIRRHRNFLRAEYLPEPAGLAELEDHFAALAHGSAGVSKGQDGSMAGELADPGHGGGMTSLLTYGEVAKALGVSLSTVKRLVRAGGLTPVAIGRNRRISLDELDAYIEQNRSHA